MLCHFSFFFFQAEDGIRDWSVTGVQTCALPISSASGAATLFGTTSFKFSRPGTPVSIKRNWKEVIVHTVNLSHRLVKDRSEERRVGKECRSRWSAYH